MRVLLILLLTSYALNAMKVEINSDDMDVVLKKLYTKDVVSTLKSMQRISYDDARKSFPLQKSNLPSEDIALRTLTSQRQSLATLLGILNLNVSTSMLDKALQKSLFHNYSDRHQEYIYSYFIKTKLSEDKALFRLDLLLAEEIVKKHGLSQTSFKQILKDMNIISSVIETNAFGTIEKVVDKSFSNPKRYDKEFVYLSGAVKVSFFPFKNIERHNSKVKTASSKNNSNIELVMSDINDHQSLEKVYEKLSAAERLNISGFIKNSKPESGSSTLKIMHLISKDISNYKRIAKQLFNEYPSCTTLQCVDTTIKKKVKELDFKGEKTFVYDLAFPSELNSYKRKVNYAFSELVEKLESDTLLTSSTQNELLKGQSYSKKMDASQLKPVIMGIEIVPYFNADALGLVVKVNVSYQSASVCQQYIKGRVVDPRLKIGFIQLDFLHKSVDASELEVTNKVFNTVLNEKSHMKECDRNKRNDFPATCVSSEMVENFFQSLNDASDGFTYRLPSCEEWQFLATCGTKVKSCWGNSHDYQLYENLKIKRYGFKIRKAGAGKASNLRFYDLCGNVNELCKDKRGRLKQSSIDPRTLEPKINKYAPGQTTGFRIYREME